MRFPLFVCLLLCACSGGDSVPDGVLPKDKMVNVFYDVIRADEMVDLRRFSDSTYNLFSKRTAIYDTVFQLHGVSQATFQKSLQFYQGRPDLLREVVEEMQKKVVDTTGGKRPPPTAIQ